MNFYNDIDPKVCAWQRELVKAGHVPPGDVDSRSIRDLKGTDLHGFTQVHLFAGILGWPVALQLAGWTADRPVWTGSCPCQSFSVAGKRKGKKDKRHLWPQMRRLIRECHPPIIFGEQVAAAIEHGWLDGVSADLEREGYAVATAVLPACCTAQELGEWEGGKSAGQHGEYLAALLEQSHGELVAAEFRQWWRDSGNYALFDCDGNSAPHKRDRIWWVGIAAESRRGGRQDAGTSGRNESARSRRGESQRAVLSGGLPDTELGRLQQPHAGERSISIPDSHGHALSLSYAESRGLGSDGGAPGHPGHPDQRRAAGGLADDAGTRREGHRPARATRQDGELSAESCGAWSDYRIVPCSDDKARRIESGLEPLAHGVPARVVRLRGYGNAIVPQVAAQFIASVMEVLNIEPDPRTPVSGNTEGGV